jgi:hypothetical protein
MINICLLSLLKVFFLTVWQKCWWFHSSHLSTTTSRSTLSWNAILKWEFHNLSANQSFINCIIEKVAKDCESKVKLNLNIMFLFVIYVILSFPLIIITIFLNFIKCKLFELIINLKIDKRFNKHISTKVNNIWNILIVIPNTSAFYNILQPMMKNTLK